MSADNPPRRRVRLTITVEADTFSEAADYVLEYVHDLARLGRACGIDRDAPGLSSGFRGSPSVRASYVLDVDRDAPVGDEYRKRLRQWAEEVRTKLAAVEDYYRARG